MGHVEVDDDVFLRAQAILDELDTPAFAPPLFWGRVSRNAVHGVRILGVHRGIHVACLRLVHGQIVGRAQRRGLVDVGNGDTEVLVP